jgi:hypothetical protein
MSMCRARLHNKTPKIVADVNHHDDSHIRHDSERCAHKTVSQKKPETIDDVWRSPIMFEVADDEDDDEPSRCSVSERRS